MANISNLAEGINPSSVAAYIDTIELFFPYRSKPNLNGYRIEECRDRNSRVWGYRLIENQPNKHTILQLDRMAREHQGVLSRFDLAVDIQPDASNSAEQVKDSILRTAVLRWRKAGPMYDEENGVYWVKWRKGGKRYPRNLVLYADRHNRFTGEVDCVHLELRFLKANTIRKQGIRFVRDLIKINPKELFEKHVAFSNAGKEYAQKAVRRHVKEGIEKAKGLKTSIFVDQYRASIHRRVKSVMKKTGQDRAQFVKDRIGTITKTIPAIFRMPSVLKWVSLKSLDNLKKGG